VAELLSFDAMLGQCGAECLDWRDQARGEHTPTEGRVKSLELWLRERARGRNPINSTNFTRELGWIV
jgi:hypothetical protein